MYYPVINVQPILMNEAVYEAIANVLPKAPFYILKNCMGNVMIKNFIWKGLSGRILYEVTKCF